MTERQELENAMAALDQQRTILGDAAVEAALAGLQQKLATLDKTEAAAPTLAGERRVVTILFCDVKGSTAMAGKLDPEEWAGIMKRAMGYLIPPVTRHDGTVARLMGDAILAFFGAPTYHEDDPQRAVRAGLEIVRGIAELREQLKRERGLDFNVRVGINTGLVFVGAIGADRRVEYTAMGDTINLAARMEQTAQPGTVQLAEPTYQLVRAWFDIEALGGIEVKGKDEPVPAYRVRGIKQGTIHARGLEQQGLSSPLVGRAQEFNAIKVSIERVLQKVEGGIVGIIGEAGLGKSRLGAEAHTFAFSNDANVMWLEGQTLSFGQTISYYPFQQVLRGWANIREDDTEATAWNKLENRVLALFGEETIDYLPYLASMLALGVQGEYAERVKYLDGDAMGKQIFLTSRRFFDRLARMQPTVLVFEDLHWMDESSTRLLEHLLPLTESAPLLIVGLSRPERNTPAAHLRKLCASDYSARYTEIRLAPLSDTDSAQLIQNILEIENLPPRVRELMVQKADGNPFFLEEVIRTLISTGAITRDASSGRWRVTAQIETLQIPDTIQGVIMARVDRLDEEVKRVLRVAAVIGRSFLYRVLDAIAEAGQQLDNELLELQATELIREKQRLPELEFMFKHALAQEATYESILLQKRRKLHGRVAQAIEELFAERLEEFYGLLAYHYARAEVWDKAQEYLLKAADQAGQMAADAEALNLYQQATDAYARAFGDKWDPVQRASLEYKMGEAFMRRGDYQQTVEHYRRALDYLGYRLPMSRSEIRLALIRELFIQIGHRLFPRQLVKPAAPMITASVEDEAWIYLRMTLIDVSSNPERFLLLELRQINVSERRGYPLGVMFGCQGLGLALDVLGVFGLAGWYHRYALAVAEQIQTPVALNTAYFGLQFHEFFGGEPGLGLEHGQRSFRAANQTGDILGLTLPASLLAVASAHLGDFSGAVAQCQQLIKLGKDAEARAPWCWGETTLGSVLRRQGKLGEAILHLQKAIELADTIPDYIYRITAGAELGLCYLRQGNYERAIAELETCLRVKQEYRVMHFYSDATIFNNLAETYLWLAEQDNETRRNVSLNKAKSACDSALKAGAKVRIRLPEAMRLRGTYEWLRGKPASARKWWDKSLAEAERMNLKYDIGMIQFEMGKRLGERAHLEKAEQIFAEIGAELDLANTRKLLKGKLQ